MNNWIETNFSVANAFHTDPKDFFLNHPEFLQMQSEGGAVWQLENSLNFVLKEDFVKKLNRYFDIEINGLLVFYRKARYQHPGAHIDVDPQGGAMLPVSTSFNWVLEEDINPMVWYKPWWDPEDIEQAKLAAKGQIPYSGLASSSPEAGEMEYQETPCDMLERDSEHCLSHERITICRTNIPHNVDMISDKERWCITVRSWGDQDPIWSRVYEKYCHMQNFR